MAQAGPSPAVFFPLAVSLFSPSFSRVNSLSGGYLPLRASPLAGFSPSASTYTNSFYLLEYHRVLKAKSPPEPPRVEYSSSSRWQKDEYVRPTQQQAATWFLIPLSTIRAQKDESQKGSKFNVQRVWTCCWPEMERRLFELFCERRNGGYIVRRYWLQKMSQKLFRQIHVEALKS